jgi:hypothetical protein
MVILKRSIFVPSLYNFLIILVRIFVYFFECIYCEVKFSESGCRFLGQSVRCSIYILLNLYNCIFAIQSTQGWSATTQLPFVQRSVRYLGYLITKSTIFSLERCGKA